MLAGYSPIHRLGKVAVYELIGSTLRRWQAMIRCFQHPMADRRGVLATTCQRRKAVKLLVGSGMILILCHLANVVMGLFSPSNKSISCGLSIFSYFNLLTNVSVADRSKFSPTLGNALLECEMGCRILLTCPSMSNTGIVNSWERLDEP